MIIGAKDNRSRASPLALGVGSEKRATPGNRCKLKAGDFSLWHDPWSWIRVGSQHFRSSRISLQGSSTSSRPR
jgi:hypothetical protein